MLIQSQYRIGCYIQHDTITVLVKARLVRKIKFPNFILKNKILQVSLLLLLCLSNMTIIHISFKSLYYLLSPISKYSDLLFFSTFLLYVFFLQLLTASASAVC